jgi:glycosyltransferase involved in cell wall biosynthesis
MPKHQLLLDLSVLVQQDDKSGIQRVVRNVLNALLQQAPPGFEVQAVYDAGGHYAYAHSFLHGSAPSAERDLPLAVQAGDIFLGLDLCPLQVPRNGAIYEDLRRHGVALYFLVYDLLPINQPEMFLAGARHIYNTWLDAASRAADGLVCISRAVADDVLAWQEHTQVPHAATLNVGYFHLGRDLPLAAADGALSDDEQAVLAQLAQRPALLMVGTLEPRKMHAQALEAFELLWQRGSDASLVIVGKAGWMQNQLEQRLRSHAEYGRRLFWLEGASDQALQQFYQRSAALLAASAGEGFGLPLVEAAAYGLPVIARDLPVFREVGGEHAYYFDGGNALRMAAAIEHWLTLHAAGSAPSSRAMPTLTWQQSTAQLLDVILHQRWYRQATTRLLPAA